MWSVDQQHYSSIQSQEHWQVIVHIQCKGKGASLGACAAAIDEPGPEGLTSTSLLDLLLPTDFEPLDSEEPSEAIGLGAGLAPGSGFPSEDSEESRLLQPPQYFWEEEELNGTSLDLGPTADAERPMWLPECCVRPVDVPADTKDHEDDPDSTNVGTGAMDVDDWTASQECEIDPLGEIQKHKRTGTVTLPFSECLLSL
ncbi:hypothetical protein STEG23_032026 [Scotinomys teguina]